MWRKKMDLTYRWRATLVIALGLRMAVLDVTIVSVVLPQIATALHAEYQTSTWIGTGYALPHEKSAFVLFTKLPPLEVVSTSATRSPPGSRTFAQRTEIALLRALRQIVPEASGCIAVDLAK